MADATGGNCQNSEALFLGGRLLVLGIIFAAALLHEAAALWATAILRHGQFSFCSAGARNGAPLRQFQLSRTGFLLRKVKERNDSTHLALSIKSKACSVRLQRTTNGPSFVRSEKQSELPVAHHT